VGSPQPIQQAIELGTDPTSYHHWKLEIAGAVATLTMDVDPKAGLRDDYELKLNSYDLGVDIELYDAAQRLRFEHPEVKVVVVTGGLDKVFCAGANIQMLAGSTHEHKVNFCKFTNETRNGIEEATAYSGQSWIAAINGTAAGGGYELALACEEILLVDDRSSAVSLPEVPLLAVLPGTGGLTRIVDKRRVRRDLADVFATRAEGIKGQQAVEWGLVDAVAPRSRFDELVKERAAARAAGSDRPDHGPGVALLPLELSGGGDAFRYGTVSVDIDRSLGAAFITVRGPTVPQPSEPGTLLALGASAWLLATVRQLDDAILRLRFNETEVGTWVLRTEGDPVGVGLAEEILAGPGDPPLLGSNAETPRLLRSHARRRNRAGQLLHGNPRRARAGGRPDVHARCQRGRRRRGAGGLAVVGCERWLVSHGKRHQPARHEVLGQRRRPRGSPRHDRQRPPRP
jgi:benzoyl-CoA-dihydrodiol lyase